MNNCSSGSRSVSQKKQNETNVVKKLSFVPNKTTFVSLGLFFQLPNRSAICGEQESIKMLVRIERPHCELLVRLIFKEGMDLAYTGKTNMKLAHRRERLHLYALPLSLPPPAKEQEKWVAAVVVWRP